MCGVCVCVGAARALLAELPRRASIPRSHPRVPCAAPPPPPPLCSSLPIPKFQHPSHSLLEENGFTQMKYEKFYARCLAVSCRLAWVLAWRALLRAGLVARWGGC